MCLYLKELKRKKNTTPIIARIFDTHFQKRENHADQKRNKDIRAKF